MGILGTNGSSAASNSSPSRRRKYKDMLLKEGVYASVCACMILSCFIGSEQFRLQPRSVAVRGLRRCVLLVGFAFVSLSAASLLMTTHSGILCDHMLKAKLVLYTFFKWIVYMLMYCKSSAILRALKAPPPARLSISFVLVQFTLSFPVMLGFYYSGFAFEDTCFPKYPHALAFAFLVAACLDLFVGVSLLRSFNEPIQQHLQSLKEKLVFYKHGSLDLEHAVRVNTVLCYAMFCFTFASYIVLFFLLHLYHESAMTYTFIVALTCTDVLLTAIISCVLTLPGIIHAPMVVRFFSPSKRHMTATIATDAGVHEPLLNEA